MHCCIRLFIIPLLFAGTHINSLAESNLAVIFSATLQRIKSEAFKGSEVALNSER